MTDAKLHARDVWVTSEKDLQAGRVNLQIAELTSFAPVYTPNFDGVNVFQNGDDVFIYDSMQGRIERVTPAFASLDQRIEVPTGSNVSYNASVLVVVRQVDGTLWAIDTTQPLAFDSLVTEPLGEFGPGATAVVSEDGTIFVASPDKGALYSIRGIGFQATKIADVDLEDFELTTVGDQPWVLERSRGVVIDGKGNEIPLPEGALRIQQPGPERDYVLVATGDALLKVRGIDDIESISAEPAKPATSTTQASAPVVLGSCVYAAWTGPARYLDQCDGGTVDLKDIPGVSPGDRGEFRVNRDAIVFNNFVSGDVFLIDQDFRLVNEWDVATPQDLDAPESDSETRVQTFEEMYAQRSETNHAPVARPDEFGVRPGKITVLPVLDNDTDVDGDVLVVSGTSGIPASAGVLRIIDDGRALLYEPAEGMTGTVSFRYTTNDGRPGGVAETTVDVTIHPDEVNEPPQQFQAGSTTVEAGGAITYNVLSNWIDPDGDDLLLVGASIPGADVVQFTPKGEVTYIHRSAELGDKTIMVTVSDGREEMAAEFHVTVEPSGSLAPIGVPDSATTFTGTYVTSSPLANDLSPSGETLELTNVEPLNGEPTVALDLDKGQFDVTAATPGTYYLKYTVVAGIEQSIGFVRVDVVEPPEAPLP
ncbi:MAG: Ig-like domain-containing protein, partial [Rhodanobacteraceae bacterium]